VSPVGHEDARTAMTPDTGDSRGAIGDFRLTLPAIKLLWDNFPGAHPEILGYKHIIALAEGRSTRMPRAPSSMRRWPVFSCRTRGSHPDLV